VWVWVWVGGFVCVCVCVCVRARACLRACVRACLRACVLNRMRWMARVFPYYVLYQGLTYISPARLTLRALLCFVAGPLSGRMIRAIGEHVFFGGPEPDGMPARTYMF
jgi:hypothetical protein